jgi:peptidoglycan hydrolase CwlO-like protein
MKKLILIIALFIILIASIYYNYINILKIKELEQKLTDYEVEFNNVISENEMYKESIEKLGNKIFSIENFLNNNP